MHYIAEILAQAMEGNQDMPTPDTMAIHNQFMQTQWANIVQHAVPSEDNGEAYSGQLLPRCPDSTHSVQARRDSTEPPRFGSLWRGTEVHGSDGWVINDVTVPLPQE